MHEWAALNHSVSLWSDGCEPALSMSLSHCSEEVFIASVDPQCKAKLKHFEDYSSMLCVDARNLLCHPHQKQTKKRTEWQAKREHLMKHNR